jgi:hypothetical protein
MIVNEIGGEQVEVRTDKATKETVFTTNDGKEFRVRALSGARAIEAFLAWRKST